MFVQNVKHKPIIIGITGGIASGKTTATDYLKDKKYPVIDSDQIVADLWKTNEQMKAQVEASFGLSTSDPHFKEKLSSLIFQNKNARVKMNHIIHPYVFQKIEEQKRDFKDEPILFIDMPLLFEVGYQKKCDHVCLVYVDPSIQKRRLMKRSNLSSAEAIRRIDAQMPIKEKLGLSDCILYNHQDKEFLYQQIDQFLRGLNDEK